MREVLDKLEKIDDRLNIIEKSSKKRGLSFEASIPPRSLCKDIVHANGVGNWENHMQILSDYYGVALMENYHNPAKVPKDSIACYHRYERSAYYKKATAMLETVLHEFFHHLHAEGVISITRGQSEEKLADKYAKIIIERGNSP